MRPERAELPGGGRACAPDHVGRPHAPDHPLQRRSADGWRSSHRQGLAAGETEIDAVRFEVDPRPENLTPVRRADDSLALTSASATFQNKMRTMTLDGHARPCPKPRRPCAPRSPPWKGAGKGRGRGRRRSAMRGSTGCCRAAAWRLRAWHEFAGEGLELETAAASAAFIARLAAPLAARGELIWVLRRDDLHAPGLGAPGLSGRAADPGLRPRRGRGAGGDGGCAAHARRRGGVRRGGRGRPDRRAAPAARRRAGPGHRLPAAPAPVRRRGPQADRAPPPPPAGPSPRRPASRCPASRGSARRAGGCGWSAAGAGARGTGSWKPGRKTMPRILSVWSPTWPIATWRRRNARPARRLIPSPSRGGVRGGGLGDLAVSQHGAHSGSPTPDPSPQGEGDSP